MSNRIIVCGGNGAGKSTLGKRLATELGWSFKDIEEYYFPINSTDYNYSEARTKEEVSELLLADMKEHENFVLASVKGEFGSEVSKLFTCAILIEVPKKLRMERVRERSNKKFGDRMLPGGDLYEKEEKFFDMVQNRPEDYTTRWLESVDVPVIRVDGTCTIEANITKIKEKLLDIVDCNYYKTTNIMI